jgi:hypothetical protein
MFEGLYNIVLLTIFATTINRATMQNPKTMTKTPVRSALLLATAVLAIAWWKIPKAFSQEKVQLMFVQTAESFKVEPTAKKLRLVNVNQQVLYFSDRPQRIAGHLTMPAYLDEWKAGEGPDNFAADPPNATLSVYEGGNRENSITVIEISKPVMDGKDMIYNYKVIEGSMPKTGGTTALFIDWIGAGGGVGPGFHGVGAGARGVGVY